jgi:hypothetical protein
MTMLRRILRAVKSNSGLNPGFENYYSKLLIGRVGDSGLPTAREAQRDRDAVLATPHYYTAL